MSRKRVFYSKVLDKVVVHTICKCGHLECDHGSTVTKLENGKFLRDAHAGNCCVKGCDCGKYTFKKHLTIDEFLCEKISPRQKDRLAATV